MAALIEIDTDRLRMRQWRAADREPFGALNADERVMEFFPAPPTRAASDALADRCETFIATHGWGLWAVEIMQTEEFIGFVGLSNAPAVLPFSPCVEVGWRLAHRFWGKGFATEAARVALQVGFTS